MLILCSLEYLYCTCVHVLIELYHKTTDDTVMLIYSLQVFKVQFANLQIGAVKFAKG